jgi:hypothetical protein
VFHLILEEPAKDAAIAGSQFVTHVDHSYRREIGGIDVMVFWPNGRISDVRHAMLGLLVLKPKSMLQYALR